jgi:hypothetical protein
MVPALPGPTRRCLPDRLGEAFHRLVDLRCLVLHDLLGTVLKVHRKCPQQFIFVNLPVIVCSGAQLGDRRRGRTTVTSRFDDLRMAD